MTAHILIVEDDALLAKFLRVTLAASGFAVHVAADGPATMSYLTDHAVDVILLDLGLPEIDGTDALRLIRAWTNVPLLVLSSRDQRDEKVKALNLGADEYLAKPFGVPELLARIRAVLHRLDQTATDATPVTPTPTYTPTSGTGASRS